MKNSFYDLGLTPPILRAIEEMGFEEPTEVQSMAIPHILSKDDLIVMAKTGSGKTAVFGVSMLQLIDPAAAGPQGLILTPTRELAVQVDSDLKLMSKHLQHKTTAVYGQHSMSLEVQALHKGVSIVSGTPGRVFDHIHHGNLITKHIRFLVLDEADRMLDMGFIDQVLKIIKTLPKDRVTLLFSATIPSEIRRICREYMKHPVTIEIESQTMTVDTIEQAYCRMERNEKRTQLNRLLLVEQPESCMIFCNTRIAVDQVQSYLSQKGYASQALHGDIPQVKRMKTMQQFKQGEFHLLVATDVAARGIHIEGLSLVINYDVPNEKDSYVHRIGRTGRAGKVGRAITFVTTEDIMSLYEIEEHIGAMITEMELPSEADYNNRRAEADKWIQANSLKNTTSQDSSESNIRTAQKKRPQIKPAQTKPEQGKPSHVKPSLAKPSLAKPSLAKLPLAKPPLAKEPLAKEPLANYSQAKPFQQSDRRRERPADIHTDYTAVQRIDTIPHTEQTKPVRKITRSVTPHSRTADIARAKNPAEIVKSQDSTAKKPFLQRVLQRILGK